MAPNLQPTDHNRPLFSRVICSVSSASFEHRISCEDTPEGNYKRVSFVGVQVNYAPSRLLPVGCGSERMPMIADQRRLNTGKASLEPPGAVFSAAFRSLDFNH